MGKLGSRTWVLIAMRPKTILDPAKAHSAVCDFRAAEIVDAISRWLRHRRAVWQVNVEPIG